MRNTKETRKEKYEAKKQSILDTIEALKATLEQHSDEAGIDTNSHHYGFIGDLDQTMTDLSNLHIMQNN
jgi:hypothetical protein